MKPFTLKTPQDNHTVAKAHGYALVANPTTEPLTHTSQDFSTLKVTTVEIGTITRSVYQKPGVATLVICDYRKGGRLEQTWKLMPAHRIPGERYADSGLVQGKCHRKLARLLAAAG